MLFIRICSFFCYAIGLLAAYYQAEFWGTAEYIGAVAAYANQKELALALALPEILCSIGVASIVFSMSNVIKSKISFFVSLVILVAPLLYVGNKASLEIFKKSQEYMRNQEEYLEAKRKGQSPKEASQ